METYTEEDLKRHSSAASLDQCLEEEGEEVRDEDSSSEGSDYLSSSSTSSVDMTANSDESSSFITFEASKSFSASNSGWHVCVFVCVCVCACACVCVCVCV